MSSFGAVLDACVLYPMYLRDTLLRAAEAGLYRVQWSATILDEMSRNIVGNGRATLESAHYLQHMMRTAFPEAEVTGYEALIDVMRNHPKDRHVMAAAVRCGAHIIVTDNLDDFPASALAPYSLEAQSADTFLTYLFYSDPESVMGILERQAAEYSHPPMTLLELLDRLVKHAPRCVHLVRAHLDQQP